MQKKEMRKQLDKELARAMLLGDDRDPSDQYKINELNIRPVLNDDEMYTIQYVVTEGVDYKINENSYSENDSKTKGVIRAAIKARKGYKGSGKPTLYTTEDFVNNALLIEDQNGRAIYDSIDYAYYAQTKQVRMLKEVFVENFIRRFAATASMTDTYQIDFYDLYESPPKVSVKVTSATNNYNIANDSTGIDIVNSIDLIVEFDSFDPKNPTTDQGCEYYAS